jgi:hypothetical protein
MIVLARQPQYPLVIDPPALAAEFRRDPAIAVMPIEQRRPLDRVAQPHLLLAPRRGPPVPVISGPADRSQLAHPLDSDLALRQRRRHRLDDRVDAVAPGAPVPRPTSLTCRKAR